MLSYVPATATSGASVSVANTTYLHREVLDVRMGNEFSFVIPYASIQTYRKCDNPYGKLQINVLNELVAPASVASSVTVLVEVSAAPDMEFALPSVPRTYNYVPLSVQGNLSFQSGMVDQCVIEDGVLANSAMFDDGLASARFCVGEKIMSLSQLTKIPTPYQEADLGDDGSEIQIWPYGVGAMATDTNVRPFPYSATWYDQIMPVFAMSRGGMRIKIIQFNIPSGIVIARQYPISQTGAVVSRISRIGSPGSYYDFANGNYNGLLTQWFDTASQPVEVQVAQYGKLHSRVNSELFVGFGINPTYSSGVVTPTLPTNFVGFQNKAQNFQSPQVLIMRATADDFQMGYFIGVPPMCRF